ncbi:putative GTD-binding domain-containing protein [Helianthus annuus]|nr:putative GTD-binding domain-containing protein [Helianthus annuus]
MESESIPPSGKECECECNYCYPINNRSCTNTWFRSVKRKLDELETETRSFLIPGLSVPEVARVEIENECDVLREMVTNQQQSIHDLAVELEKERNASSSAANEAMSMILRLQREKAGIEMEARQFKRFAEQKSNHDQQEIAALEELLYKREQTIQSLTCEVQAYKYRMMSYGLTESEAEGVKGVITHSHNSIASNSDTQSIMFDEYPPLKCHTNEQQAYPESEHETEIIDIEKYAFSETQTPCSIKDIEHRIIQLERSSPRHQPVLEKVVVGNSPRIQKPSTRYSMDSAGSGSFFAMIKEEDPNFKKVENESEYGSEINDRIYTVDAVHYGAPAATQAYHNEPKENMNACDDYMSNGKDSVYHGEIQDPEVMKLYARLQALEADRESMRQAIINMRTDKAQLVLLKEIAQNLCKDMSPTSRMPVKKQSYFWAIGQSVVSFVLWRKNASQTKYMTASNRGLMVVLDKNSEMGQWRCVSKTQLGAMEVCLKNTAFAKVMVKL